MSKKDLSSNKINACADDMLNKILQCYRDEKKKNTYIDSAIIKTVNSNGTVDIYLPPDEQQIFTNISNQTPFLLNPGDSVEVLVKNGKYSNCWIIAKHGISYNELYMDNLRKTLTIEQNNITIQTIKDVVYEILKQNSLI